MKSCFVSWIRAEEDGDAAVAPALGLRDGVLLEVWCAECAASAECAEAREMEASVAAFEQWLLDDGDDAGREALASSP